MGFTASSWNSVGMLAVITRSGLERAGRESGVLMFGFMLGLGIGPPIQGWSVDLTGELQHSVVDVADHGTHRIRSDG